MSTLVLERQQSFDDIFGRESDRRHADADGDRSVTDASHPNRTDAHGWLTLDDLVTGVWEGLAVCDTVHCPACGGTMASRGAAGAEAHEILDGAREGTCLDCGIQLS
jgi:hypothetical protein